MNPSIADIAHEIIAMVKENNRKIQVIREKIPSKSQLLSHVESVLLAKMCTDSESVIRELSGISARVLRQGDELRHLNNLVDEVISEGKR